MLNIIFAITMLGFMMFSTIFITFVAFVAFDEVLKKIIGIGLFDIVEYAISAVLNVFFPK